MLNHLQKNRPSTMPTVGQSNLAPSRSAGRRAASKPRPIQTTERGPLSGQLVKHRAFYDAFIERGGKVLTIVWRF